MSKDKENVNVDDIVNEIIVNDLAEDLTKKGIVSAELDDFIREKAGLNNEQKEPTNENLINQIIDERLTNHLTKDETFKLVQKSVETFIEEFMDSKMKKFINIVAEMELPEEDEEYGPEDEEIKNSVDEKIKNSKKVYNELLLNGKKQPFNIVLIPIDEKGQVIKKYAPLAADLILDSKVTIKEIFLAIKKSYKK